MAVMKFLRDLKNPSMKINLRDDRLLVSEKEFTWDKAGGLRCGMQDGLEALNILLETIPACLLKAITEITKDNNEQWKQCCCIEQGWPSEWKFTRCYN